MSTVNRVTLPRRVSLPFLISAGLLTLVPGPLFAGKLILQDNPAYGYSGTTDTWLDESAQTDNYGGAANVRIQYNSGVSDATLLKFDLPTVSFQSIASATLELYYYDQYSMSGDNAVWLTPYRITPGMSWYENVYNGTPGHGASWKYRDDPETLQWTGQYGAWYDKLDDGNSMSKIKRDGGSVPDAIAPPAWVPWSVASSVSQWYGGQTNNGFVLFESGFQGSGSIAAGLFESRESATTANRPKLTIIYQGARIAWGGHVDGMWDAATANWAIGGYWGAFDNGDHVTFGVSIVSNITVTGGGVSPGSVTFTNAAGRYTLYGGAINGACGLAKHRAGEIRLTAPNSYSGLTDLAGGTLLVATNLALGSTATGTVVRSGATLLIEGGVAYDAPESLSLSGSGSTGAGALLTTAGTTRFAGAVTLAAPADIGAPSNATLTLSGPIGGACSWRKVGEGTVALSGTSPNTHTGALTVLRGTLRLAKNGCVAIPSALDVGDGTQAASVIADAAFPFAATATVSVAAQGLLDLQLSTATLSALTMSGGRVTAAGLGTLAGLSLFDPENRFFRGAG
ncbi:MAG: DNRLRE domain-containing protein, partial [bacterium]